MLNVLRENKSFYLQAGTCREHNILSKRAKTGKALIALLAKIRDSDGAVSDFRDQLTTHHAPTVDDKYRRSEINQSQITFHFPTFIKQTSSNLYRVCSVCHTFEYRT